MSNVIFPSWKILPEKGYNRLNNDLTSEEEEPFIITKSRDVLQY